MPCKKLQIPLGPSVDHIYAQKFHLAHISDWNRRTLLWQGYSFIFFTSDFINLRVCRVAIIYTGFRGNQRNQIP